MYFKDMSWQGCQDGVNALTPDCSLCQHLWMCDGYAVVDKSHSGDIGCQTSCIRTTWTSHLGRRSLSVISRHKEVNVAVSSMS